MAYRTSDTPAELVLRGGPVETFDDARRRAEAVAVVRGRIAAVGSTADVRPFEGPRTRVVDLAGRLLVPGFQDAHVHPIHAGLAHFGCDLHEARGRDACVAAVARYAADHPTADWILGGGWYMDDFPAGTPHRADLDAVVADRPVFLTNRDGHGAWVNGRALELGGISRDARDPADGRIERDPDGEPSGTLHEGAMALVESIVPPPTVREREAALTFGQAYLHSLGITGWQDAIVEPDDLETYRAVAGRGELTGRVVGALWWDRARGLEQIDELVAARATGTFGRFRATSVKIMQDGVLENFTGAVLEPYLGRDGRPTTNRGKSFVEASLLREAVSRLDALGFQVHFHCIGERAVREALDAVEAARAANGPNDNRHHIAHIQVIHPEDVPRFAALGVTANMQPLWACHEGQMDRLTIPFLGPERSGWQYPFASLARSGARLAGGSDWSVSTPNVLWEAEVAVERVWPESRGSVPPFLPDEGLDLRAALSAFTSGTAFVNHLDDTGTIAPGQLADLAVLDRDVFDRANGPIGDGQVLGTFVQGVPVFEAPGLDR